MITDRVLIFSHFEVNINTGGPSGFLAHNLLDKPRSCFLLLGDVIHPKRFKFALNKFIFDHSKKSNDYISFLFKEAKAKDYKYLYFHDCISMYKCLPQIKNNQTIILQSHSPELPSEEIASLTNNIDIINFHKLAEKKSFERADIIVFPTKGCTELYNSVISQNNQLEYILSGAKSSNDLKTYPLDQSKINLLFIGRRNKIKGFDIILDSFKEIAKKRDDLNLLLIGGGEKINSKNVYDIGFSNTPLNWYNNVDYVINSNRQSYFDLSVIEALSTSVPMIIADNFGHKYFTNKSKDIITFDSSNCDNLTHILNGDLEKKTIENKSNRKLYLEELTDTLYFKRFSKFCNKIM